MEHRDLKKQITAHYIAAWGVPTAIGVVGEPPFELAIMEFGPTPQQAHWRIATNGLSSILQSGGAVNYRTEVFACSQAPAPWIADLLTAIATYPPQCDETLAEFDTIPFDGPVERGGLVYSGALLVPPGEDEPQGLVHLTLEPLLIYQVVAITAAEMDFAVEVGGEPLWERLQALDAPLLLDAARPTAV